MIRWAIASTGKMAATFAAAFEHVPDAELAAVASRTRESASGFASAHGVPRALTYDQLWADADVDAVYIASPHTSHAELALAAIAAGKGVLVEKAFTASLDDTEAVIDAARERGVFCMEAMWTRCLPAAQAMKELVEAGQIGQIRSMQGDLTAFRAFDPNDRLFDPDAGGGAVLDLGVYVVSFVQWLMGTPTRVQASGGLLPNGVEGGFGAVLGYTDGRFATIQTDFTGFGPGRFLISGTRGWIDVHPRFHRMGRFTVHTPDADPRLVSVPADGAGYAHELAEATRCLRAGLTESPVVPLDDTLAVQEVMAELLAQLR